METTKREALVLIPGLLCTAALFEPQVRALGAERDVTVADHTRHDSVEMLAADILSTAPRQFALAGLSMGGYVALEIMRQARDRVTRLALMDTNAHADNSEQKQDRRRLIEIAHRDGTRKVQSLLLPGLVAESRLTDKALVETVLKMGEDTGPDAFERQEEAIMRRPDSRLSLSGIHVPTLVLVGREDMRTPVSVAEEIHKAIAGSQLVVVPECGHLSTLEQPAAINDAMAEWLSH